MQTWKEWGGVHNGKGESKETANLVWIQPIALSPQCKQNVTTLLQLRGRDLGPDAQMQQLLLLNMSQPNGIS